MIVISQSLVLAAPATYEPNNPVIGWHNLVTAGNVSASSAAAGYPVTNLANPITAPIVRWRAGDAGAQTVAAAVDSIEEIDYVAIARHNLGSQQIPVAVEGSINAGADWTELIPEHLLPDDAPAIFRLELGSKTDVRLALDESPGDPAEIAVMYVGKLLTLQRRLYVGHTPITMGRSAKIVNGMSEGGDFLGRLILSEQTGTTVDLQNLTPDWYRSEMDPFVRATKDTPFFFAWRPFTYPREVGFAWANAIAQPQNQRPNGMMQVNLQMTGIAP